MLFLNSLATKWRIYINKFDSTNVSCWRIVVLEVDFRMTGKHQCCHNIQSLTLYLVKSEITLETPLHSNMAECK